MLGAGVSEVRPAYRPQIDGVRAVAVSIVVLFHLGFAWIPGGFVGVDVFFVLSGYLISGLLITEVAARGSVSLSRFYARRARRLLPAAWVVIVFTVLVGRTLVAPIEYENLRRHAMSAVLYVANWDWATVDRGYFATDTEPSPLIHFWTLAVEEQFYVVWPALVLGCVWLAQRTRIALLAVVALVFAAITLASIGGAIALTPSAAAYYGTHTRAFELAAGGLLAVAMRLRHQRSETDAHRARRVGPLQVGSLLLTALGIAGIAYLSATISGSTSYPGWPGVAVTAVSVLLIAGVDLGNRTWAATALGNPLFSWAGKLSYSIYLWHWPLIVFWKDDLGTGTVMLLIVVASLVSYFLVEQPVRVGLLPRTRAWKVAVTGLAVSVVLGVFVIPVALHNSMVEQQVIAARRDISEPPKDCPYNPGEWPSPQKSQACVVYDGDGPSVLLIGDSHAQMWAPAFLSLAKRNDWQLNSLTRSRCTPTDFTVRRPGDRPGQKSIGAECTEWRHTVYPRVVEETDPDYVVVGSRSQVYDISVGDRVVRQGDRAWSRIWRSSWIQPITLFGAHGAAVLVLEPMPTLPKSMLSCVATGADADCSFDEREDTETLRADRFVHTLPTRLPGLHVLEVADIVCPGHICPGRMDGVVVHQDPSHVTATFAKIKANALGRLLAAAGLDAPP
ncbi:MAG: acyltransferase [Propionibacteriales bacterium]|nr:acyltransferase [Propionibacteriales bacterium]